MAEKFDRDLVRGSLDLMVLSSLADGPKYGYLIQKQIREASAGRVRILAGSLYPILHRLETDKTIRSRWDRTSGRDRKWYELTAVGRRRLHSEADQWNDYVASVRSLLAPALRAAPRPA